MTSVLNLILISLILIAKSDNVNVNIVNISLTNKIINTTSSRFVSFNMDYGIVWQNYTNLSTNEQLQYLAGQFSPAFLRIGGTSGDFSYLEVGDENPCKLPPPYNGIDGARNYTCLSMQKFDDLVSFVRKANISLIYSLSIGYPIYPNISTPNWNSNNAHQFLQYLHDDKGYDHNDIAGFQLGNEINFGDPFWNAQFQANAFKQLDNILTSLWGKDHGFKLFGPDPHSGTVRNYSNYSTFEYLTEFYNSTCNILHGGTYHIYIDVNASEMLLPSGLNVQYIESERVNHAFYNYNYTKDNECMKQLSQNIYASEFSPTTYMTQQYENITNRYANGFWYLDALGTVATLGQKGAWRWVLYSHCNDENENLLDCDYNKPNPDYFTGLLFKYLMGINVLQIESNDEYLRVYAHCTSTLINQRIYNVNNKNLTLINPISIGYVNLNNNNNNQSTEIKINNLNQLIDGKVIIFRLTADSLDSRTMKLNGNELSLNVEGKLPSLEGQIVELNQQSLISVPSMSYGFIVFTQTSFSQCKL